MEIKTDSIAELLKEQIAQFDVSFDVAEVGEVIMVGDGVARVSGLENVMSSELVELPNGVFGMALNLEDDNVGLVLFGDSRLVKEGDLAKSAGRVVEVPVGEAMLGRVVNPLGQAIDGKPAIESKDSLAIERKALGVMARSPVNEPLQTGIKAIDSMIPIGRGQRELIIGDRQTGKTAVAIDAIINQKSTHSTDVLHLCGNRAESFNGGFHRFGVGRKRRHGLHNGGCSQCIRPCTDAVYCSVCRLCHGRIFQRQWKARPYYIR